MQNTKSILWKSPTGQNKTKNAVFTILVLAIIGVVFISGCVQQAPTEQEEKPSGVNGAEEGTLEDCIGGAEVLSAGYNRDLVYQSCALGYKSIDTCRKISTPEGVDQCYFAYAVQYKDTSACDKISSEEEEKSCRELAAQGIPEDVIERPEDVIERPVEKQNDANSGGDVSADVISPFPIDYGEWKGMLTGNDDGDAYGIRWNPGDTIDIVVAPSKGLDIALMGQAGGYPINPRNDGFKGEQESIKMTGDITMNIKRIDILIETVSGSGDYTLKITTAPQNDGNSGKDAPGDDLDKTDIVVSAGKYENCYMGSKDDWDFYKVRLNAGQRAVIKAIPSSELDVQLTQSGYCPMGASEYCTNDNFKGGTEEMTITADEGGIYAFGAGKVGETKGNYTLDIAVK